MRVIRNYPVTFYLTMIMLAIVMSWAIAYYSEWWAGMGLLTWILIQHALYTAKEIRRT